MEVHYEEGDTRYFCDACQDEIVDEYPMEFIVEVSYGAEDECYGCLDGERELMDELGDTDSVREYMAQPQVVQCETCRNMNLDHYIRKFEEEFRKHRVALIRKLAKEKILPEFSEDKDIKEDRLKHWTNIKEDILTDLKGDLTEWGYESKAKELLEAMEKIRGYSN